MVSGWNTGAERTFGYLQQEILGEPAARFFTAEDAEKGEPQNDLSRALANGRSENERWLTRKDGTRFWARWVTTSMHDDNGELRGFAQVLRDETEKKHTEDRLNASLKEKEVLLREIHHRVKNNLHVIAALLSLQAAQVSDEVVQRMLDELQNRVRAIAGLHETLSGSPNLADILFGPYMDHIVRDLVAFHQFDSKHIIVRVESDDVVLSMAQALPLGLIVNELTTNALKYAFANGRDGTLTVSLRYVPESAATAETLDDGCCELRVDDDGPGFSDPNAFWHGNSMGLQIVQLLTQQLQGTLTLGEAPGTRICIRFRS